jgi:hypothetical protein
MPGKQKKKQHKPGNGDGPERQRAHDEISLGLRRV